MNTGKKKNGGDFSSSSEINIFDRLFHLAREKEEQNVDNSSSIGFGIESENNEKSSKPKISVDPIAQKPIKQEEIDDDISITEERQSILQIAASEKSICVNPLGGNVAETVISHLGGLERKQQQSQKNPVGFIPLSHFSIDVENFLLTTNQRSVRLNRLAASGSSAGATNPKKGKNQKHDDNDDDNFTLIELSHCDAIGSVSAVQILENVRPSKDDRGQDGRVNQPVESVNQVGDDDYQPIRASEPIVKVKRRRKRRSDFGEIHKKRKLVDDVESLDDVLDIWEAKLELQVACGFDAGENLHVTSLIKEAISRIESLEYQREVAVKSSQKLLKDQKKLLFRLIKPLTSKGKHYRPPV